MVYSGQKSVAATGTAEQVSSDTAVRTYLLRAHPDNTGDIFIGNDGANDVSSANGFPLSPDDGPIAYWGKLSDLYVDVETNDEKVCWLATGMG